MTFNKWSIPIRTTLRQRRREANERIIERINNGEPLQKIADDFGLSVAAIKQIWQRARN